jgi:hypothetical protein
LIAQQIEAVVSALVMRIPEAAMAWVLGDETSVDGLRLDRQTQFLLYLQKVSERPVFGEMTVEETRAMMDGLSNGLGPGARYMASVVDRAIPGQGGEIAVTGMR